ncbi:hypothetical protein [Nocardia sp. NPDC056100]
MTNPETCSAASEENAAVAALGEHLRAMAAMLHNVDDSRYSNPSGGYVLS